MEDLCEIQAMQAEIAELWKNIQHAFKMLEALKAKCASKMNRRENVFLKDLHHERKRTAPRCKCKGRMFL